MLRNTIRVTCVGAVVSVVVGCQPPDEGVYIEARLVGDHEEATAFGSHLVVRAVPDHVEGFSPARPYLGERVYEGECPLDHIDFPLDFILSGSDRLLHRAPPRWLLLAWITDDPRATWVAEGQLYGTTTFEFTQDAYAGHWAEGLVVELDQVRAD
jgi:hypothetical protein